MAAEPTERPNLPAIAICGHSGSGKTTLLEKLIPRLSDLGLNAAVLKHDVHGLTVDTPGKDSDRLYQAGADVMLQGPEQSLVRIHGNADAELLQVLTMACPHYDLILVEGRKWTPHLDKIWLRRDEADAAPDDAKRVLRDLSRDVDRVEATMACLQPWLKRCAEQTTVYGGILVGGASSRMGQPKQMMTHGAATWFERAVSVLQERVERVVVLGSGELPETCVSLTRLPDPPGMKGPLAGMLAGMRWAPSASWVFVACDMPLITGEAIDWLLETRAPGVWATLPRLTDSDFPEPLLAHYDFRAHALLEGVTAPHQVATHAKVMTPPIPPELADAWRNVNNPEDLDALATE